MKRYRTPWRRITGRRAFELLDRYLAAGDQYKDHPMEQILDALREHIRADLDTARRARGERR